MMSWFQKTVTLAARKRGCHLVTDEVLREVDLNNFEVGMCNVFIQHTSASLTLNENYDPDVRTDMESTLNRIVPEGKQYIHDSEGPDDMPAHVKTSLIGASLTIPITAGKLALGTWQGIWLCEHRNSGGPRRLVVTIQGALRSGSSKS